jgi:hypothetical protein
LNSILKQFQHVVVELLRWGFGFTHKIGDLRQDLGKFGLGICSGLRGIWWGSTAGDLQRGVAEFGVRICNGIEVLTLI